MSDDSRGTSDLPWFNPRMGRRNGAARERAPTLKLAVIRRLARMASGWRSSSAGARSTQQRARHDIRPAPPLSRRCVIKARYVPMRAGGIKAARQHLAYIERDGVEQDGSKGRLFDGHGDVGRDVFAAPIAGEQRQFRFIISPEDGNELDLRDYTSRLIQRMEKDLGRGLRWAAVCHYNTDNPHVHVVVRGVDRRGAELRIDRFYISEGLRIRGQELATLELGPRTEFDVTRQLTNEVAQERLTTIDRRLAELVSPHGTIDMPAIVNARRLSRPHALARLETLERLDLVERTAPTSWRVADGWQETLQQLGQRGDIIKRMHQALQGRASSYRVFQPGTGAAIEGVIKQKGLHDELAGDPYVIVQTARMEAVYIRVDQATAATLKEGAPVRFACETQPWVKGTDHVIQREAASNGGIYSPTAHLRKLGDRPIAIEGRWVSPEAVVEVNQRRLERLARYNLVARQPDGNWRVPANLVDLLRSREQTHPQFRLQVEQLGLHLERGKNRGPSLGR
jgi:type IV secretory pathway VirD2 relaxase